MRRVLLSIAAITLMVSCGGETKMEETKTEAPVVNETEILEIENATDEVVEGLNELENNVESMSSDIDSLLNGL